MSQKSAEQPNIAHFIKRLDSLETQLAFQEDTISELNDLLTQQGNELQRIQKHLMIVAERLQQIPEGNNQNPIDERPPHY